MEASTAPAPPHPAEVAQDPQSFANDEAGGKLLYLALWIVIVNLEPPYSWRIDMQHMILLFGDRVPTSE